MIKKHWIEQNEDQRKILKSCDRKIVGRTLDNNKGMQADEERKGKGKLEREKLKDNN